MHLWKCFRRTCRPANLQRHRVYAENWRLFTRGVDGARDGGHAGMPARSPPTAIRFLTCEYDKRRPAIPLRAPSAKPRPVRTSDIPVHFAVGFELRSAQARAVCKCAPHSRDFGSLAVGLAPLFNTSIVESIRNDRVPSNPKACTPFRKDRARSLPKLAEVILVSTCSSRHEARCLACVQRACVCFPDSAQAI